MKNIYDPAVVQEICQRLDMLQPDTPRKWGTMNAAQMMAHCAAALEVNLGERVMEANLISRLMGPFIRPIVLSEKPYRPGLPTDKTFIMAGEHDFIAEKARLKTLIKRFSAGGEAPMAGRKHPVFGKLSPMEWSKSTYKHLDHHLKQFGA